MISKNVLIAFPLAVVLALGITSCGAEPGPSTGNSAPGGSSQSDHNTGTPANGALDEKGYAIPGQVLDLKLGESVAYYLFSTLSKNDVQRVTISAFDYIERADLPDGKHMDRMENGVLVLTLSWESVEGKVQSNQGYVIATLDTGEVGRPTAFMDNRMKNGRVDAGETKTGVFTIDIPRGLTTLTIVDYQDAPVARMVVDTRK